MAAIKKSFAVEGGLVVNDSAVISGLLYPLQDGTYGQVLTTDGNGNLTFTTVTSGGASTLAELTDVILTGLAHGGLLQYDSDNQQWVPSTELDTPNVDQNITTDGGSY